MRFRGGDTGCSRPHVVHLLRQTPTPLEKPRGGETAGDAGLTSQQPLGAVLGAGLRGCPREVGALPEVLACLHLAK